MNTEKILLEVTAPKTDLPGIEHLIARIEVAERRMRSATYRLAEFQRRMSALPDVSRAGSNPTGGGRSRTGMGKLDVTLPASAFIVTVNGKIPIRLTAQDFAAEVRQTKVTTPTVSRGPEAAEDRGSMSGRISNAARWAAAGGVVYGGAKAVRYGGESVFELNQSQARLQQVFRGDDVQRLTDDILQLAVANGRLTKESMDSAIQWSRLGYTRIQVLEAIRVSLMAANVAEMTAADSTERLSSVAASFRLEASQLASVLGMLNQVSNTFNVTNKAMLDGVARSASIARQAGLSLADLIGIVGSAIGTSGQTGAVIGTATKSIIGHVANASNQQTLRDYGIEPTNGEGEAKKFSEVLADIFVKYQQLNRAERQSLLFGVAGTNQASRLATMLDSYVKGQVLAIEAQLNLNSAEKENALIVETLRSQYAGLVSEFDRFANLQAQNGIGDGLGEVAKLLKNVLSLINAVPSLATVAAGALAMVGARLALTGAAMDQVGKKGVTESLKERWAALGQVATRAIDAYPQLGSFARDGLATGPATRKDLSQVAVGAQAAGKAAAAAAPQIGLLRGSLSLLLASAASLGPAMIAGVAGVVLFNRVVEGLGLSSDSTAEKVRALSAEAESAAKAIEAVGQAQRFLDTSRRALQVTRDSSKRAEIIDAVSQVATPVDSAATDKQREAIERRRTALRGELTSIMSIGDATERNKKLDAAFRAAQGELLARAAAKRGEEAAAITSQQATIRSEINRLESGPTRGLDSTKNRVKELRAQLDDLSNQSIKQLIDDFDDLSKAADLFAQNSQALKNWVESLKGVSDGISGLYESLPRANKSDDLHNEVLKLTTIRNLHAETLKILKEKQASGLALGDLQNQASLNGAIKRQTAISVGLGEELIAARERQKTLTAIRGSDSLANTVSSEGQVDQVAAEIARLERLKARSDAKLGELRSQIKPEAIDKNTAIDAQIKAVKKEKEDTEKSLARASAQVPFAQVETRRQIATSIGSAEAGSFAVGENVGAQLSNQRRSLDMSVQQHQLAGRIAFIHSVQLSAMGQLAAAAKMRVTMENEYLIAAVQSKELDTTRLKIAEEALDLQKQLHNEVKAYQRTLLGAGPGELLRKLAVGSLGKLNSGQFFSLDTGARNDYMSQPGNSQAARSLRELIKNNPDILGRAGRPNVEALQAAQIAEGNRRNDIMQAIHGSAVDAADSLVLLRTNASGAASSLALVEEAAQSLALKLDGISNSNSGPPANPQSPRR